MRSSPHIGVPEMEKLVRRGPQSPQFVGFWGPQNKYQKDRKRHKTVFKWPFLRVKRASNIYLFCISFSKKKLPQKVKTENCSFYAFLKGWEVGYGFSVSLCRCNDKHNYDMSSVLCYPQLFKTQSLIINLVCEWLADGFCIRFWCCFYLLKTLIICLYHAIMSAYKHIYFASIQTLVLIQKTP